MKTWCRFVAACRVLLQDRNIKMVWRLLHSPYNYSQLEISYIRGILQKDRWCWRFYLNIKYKKLIIHTPAVHEDYSNSYCLHQKCSFRMMSLGSRNVNTRSAVKSLYIRSQVLDVLDWSELLKLVPRPLGDEGLKIIQWKSFLGRTVTSYGVGSKKSA